MITIITFTYIHHGLQGDSEPFDPQSFKVEVPVATHRKHKKMSGEARPCSPQVYHWIQLLQNNRGPNNWTLLCQTW